MEKFVKKICPINAFQLPELKDFNEANLDSFYKWAKKVGSAVELQIMQQLTDAARQRKIDRLAADERNGVAAFKERGK